ncbi:hypothetical protein QTQ03_09660 [Micromonospora sp. WMMA1363]|uniref:hypothetical protein n=1 Tax=Micromonospora sp. WMMA1363 TaxID=3053985 RepID=UPI00259C95D3|nr:hypothetical protein [Micromonospora sp. WMMA1363]MDM4719828.1 hypothetical protein [Micromonospora sp. WMMA1363]
MSSNLRSNDDPTRDKNSPFRRRRLWLVTGVAGLTGAVSLAGVAYATTGVTGAHRLADVKWSTAQLVDGKDDKGKDDKDHKGKDDKDHKGKDDKDHKGKDDKDHKGKDWDDDGRVREVPCDDNKLIESLDWANRHDGGTLKLSKDCTYELDEFDKKSETGTPTIKEKIKIEGNGSTIKRDSKHGFRIFRVADGGDLKLKDLEIKNGAAGDVERRKHDKDDARESWGSHGDWSRSGDGAPAPAPALRAAAPLPAAPPAPAPLPAAPLPAAPLPAAAPAVAAQAAPQVAARRAAAPQAAAPLDAARAAVQQAAPLRAAVGGVAAPAGNNQAPGGNGWHGDNGGNGWHGDNGGNGWHGDNGGNGWHGDDDGHGWDGKDDREHKGDGGGLLVERGGSATLVNTTWFLNSAENNGGAVANFGRLDVESSTFDNNHAGSDGGAIFNAGVLDVSGSHDGKGGESRITNNTAGKNGGGVANGHGDRDKKKDDWDDKKNDWDKEYDSRDSRHERHDKGNRAGTVDIEKTTIEGNAAKKNGGGLFSNDGFVEVRWTYVKDNTAGEHGGGIYAVDTVLTVKDSHIKKNKAHKDGGGIYNVDGYKGDKKERDAAWSNGGYDHEDKRATATVSDSEILENSAGRFGGGVFNGEPIEEHNGEPAASNWSKDKNNGDDFGASLVLRHSKVKENFAGKNGGGIYNNEGKVTLTKTKVTKNKADNGDTHNMIAGGVFNNDGKVKFDEDSTITDNDPTNCAKTVDECYN